MQIIGEKINGTREGVARAIAQRDTAFIQGLARKQAEAGAALLDVNAGTPPSREVDDLVWLVETIQAELQIPLCLDSINPKALAETIKVVNCTPMINSISGEPDRLEGILPLVAEHGCQVIALAMDDKGIPQNCEGRMVIIRRLMEATRFTGVPDGQVYIDPLAMAIATNIESGLMVLDTMRAVRQEFPEAHLTLGLSNISYGFPARSHINQAFLTLALAAGLDSAIMDPLDSKMQAAIVSTELVLGRDPDCLNYLRAFRSGMFNKL